MKMPHTLMTPEKRAPAVYYEPDAMLSGGEARLARRPELVSWFTKVWVEKAKGSRPWAEFSDRGLGRFLKVLGIDLAKAEELHEDALTSLPRELRDPESSIPILRGLKFVVVSPERAAMNLRQRYQAAARG